MNTLPHQLERSIFIEARPKTVFAFFTDSARWAAWWGAGSTIDPRPGGRFLIRYPNGIEAHGEVLDIVPPQRIVFSFGYASGKPFAPGSTQVTISLQPEGTGTRVNLQHAFPDLADRDAHVQGWRYQLSLFANVVTDEVNARASDLVDAWFTAWVIPDRATRRECFAGIVSPSVSFRDSYSTLEGIEDLVEHSGATQTFMPGVKLTRTGAVRHRQGMVLADWTASGQAGPPVMSGTNVFILGADGKIQAVTGFAEKPAST